MPPAEWKGTAFDAGLPLGKSDCTLIIDPAGALRFMQRLAERDRKRGDDLPAFFRTHPLTSERVRLIDARILALPPTRYLPPLVDWRALQAALPEDPRGPEAR